MKAEDVLAAMDRDDRFYWTNEIQEMIKKLPKSERDRLGEMIIRQTAEWIEKQAKKAA